MTPVFLSAQEGDSVTLKDGSVVHGEVLSLADGGATVSAGGQNLSQGEALGSEYDGLYARFARLIATRTSEVDLSPLKHVADAFMLGRRLTTDPFIE